MARFRKPPASPTPAPMAPPTPGPPGMEAAGSATWAGLNGALGSAVTPPGVATPVVGLVENVPEGSVSNVVPGANAFGFRTPKPVPGSMGENVVPGPISPPGAGTPLPDS